MKTLKLLHLFHFIKLELLKILSDRIYCKWPFLMLKKGWICELMILWCFSYPRFCFHLHYFSGCLLGTPPVSCREDLCSHRTCSGNPEALCRVRACGTCTLEWYDGITGQQIECQEGGSTSVKTTWYSNQCVHMEISYLLNLHSEVYV